MDVVIETRTAHTSQLAGQELRELRDLLDAAFDNDFTDEDFDHALGGMHALAFEGDALVGHGAVVMRRLVHGSAALRTGYVEAVAVRADQRHKGVGARVMDAVERIVRGGYELGALGAADGAAHWYAARGWQQWSGATSVLTPEGVRRTPGEDGAVYVLPVTAQLTTGGDLVCDWRTGDVW
jgi:aminoglycoside 2'-N-acetyltransferase I